MSAVLSLAVILQLAATPACTASEVPAANVAAVVRQESRFHPYAIRDETTDRSYYPDTREDAEALAVRLTAQGHLLGVGLMQLTPPANFGLSIAEAFDPCKNMKAGAELLAANFKLEWQALMRALSRYNSGSPTRAEAYAKRVFAQAQRNARMPSLALAPLIDAPVPPGPAKPRHAPPAPKPPCAPTWDVWAVCRSPEALTRPRRSDHPTRRRSKPRPMRRCSARLPLGEWMISITGRTLAAAASLLAFTLLWSDAAFAQAAGGDPFTEAVNWFVGGPARGVAMLAIACVAVLAWVFTASLRAVGFVLGGGLVLANIDTIVGWMGF